MVKFSKRERSDDTGLMDDSSVAWSSLAMAAGMMMMGQWRRWFWLSTRAADCGMVESMRRQQAGPGSWGLKRSGYDGCRRCARREMDRYRRPERCRERVGR